MIKKRQKATTQDRKKGTERVQTKPGKTNIDYWSARLLKRTYTGRDGIEVEIPDWQIRIKHVGRVVYFNLKTANAAEAAGKARDIYVFLIANGWEATFAKFKPKPEEPKPVDPTIDEFTAMYQDAVVTVEYPPQPQSVQRYIKSFTLICRWLNIKRLGKLTTAKISEFKLKYLKKGRGEGKDENSVKISCNAHLRNGAAMFSKQMSEAYEKLDVVVKNPFTGLKIRRIEIKPYTPMQRDLLDRIWEDAAKLRDGDPNAPIPVKPPRAKKGEGPRKRHRWTMPDWRKPHPEAFTILLEELGLGFRRNEADKAEWDWFFTDAKGRKYVEIKTTKYFVAKGKKRRVLPVEEALWDAIHQGKKPGTQFVVPGRAPKEYTNGKLPKNKMYRCEEHHRTLTMWLRMKGVDDDKPCHKLRKEFGSYVATSFGLFATQRLLGHSAPTVTEAYYAGLTNLPELNHAKVPPQQAA